MAPVSDDGLDEIGRELAQGIEGRVHRNYPLAKLTSFRLGGPAGLLIEPSTSADVAKCGRTLVANGIQVLVVGRGTNVLVSDLGYSGAVIRLGKSFDWITAEGDRLEAGASTPLPRVANKAMRLSLEGLEFSVAIPATVGGSVRTNAGAHGASVSDVIDWTEVCELDVGKLVRMDASQLRMRYRTTSLTDNEVVCSASFLLRSGDKKEIAQRMESFRRHRTDTQPVEAPNAGSMFRNPEGDAAGRLVEATRLKGFRVGGAEVSNKHANFFLAQSGAKAQDVYDLMAQVQRRVRQMHRVLLIPEVRIVGEFDRSAGLVEFEALN